jgi:hypothetical protein
MARELSTDVVTLVGQDSTSFQEIFVVEDSSVLPKGMEVIDKLQPVINRKTYEFNLSEAVELVKSDPRLVILQALNSTISHENIEVEQMVDIVLKELNNLINVTLPEQFRKTIIDIFTNLHSQEYDEWFYLSSLNQFTTYQYNVAFVIQNEETGWLFYVVPVGLTIHTNLDVQKLLFIKLKDKVNYIINIKAIKIAVQIA